MCTKELGSKHFIMAKELAKKESKSRGRKIRIYFCKGCQMWRLSENRTGKGAKARQQARWQLPFNTWEDDGGALFPSHSIE